MNVLLARYFQFEKLGTNVRQEALAGFTTFLTLAYIIIVNPKILEAAGIPFGPAMVATIITGFLGTMLMGVYARRPFAIAPYMGQNAFVAYTLVKVMGYPWQVVLGGVFISGFVFALLTITQVRGWLVNAIPTELKVAFSAGLGLFLSFIGLNVCGIVRLGVEGAPVQIGYFNHADVWMSILGFFLMSVLMVRKVRGAIFIGISTITLLAFLLGMVTLPSTWVDAPPSILPTLGKMDILGALTPQFLPIVLIMLILIFVDTMGTLIGVAHTAGFLDKDGNLPDIEKPMLCDSLATMAGAFLGTSTAGAYVESLAGIEAGGRSGFTSVVTALLFLLALFFAPLFVIVPSYAYGPALIIIGMMMMASVKQLNVEDVTEMIPAFVTIILTVFTYNLGIGMTGGFITYPLLKVISGRSSEVSGGLWVLGFISLLFFICYPY